MKNKFIITTLFVSFMANVIFTGYNQLNAADKVQIKWYIQLSNDDSDPFTTALYQYVEMYNNSQERIEVIIVPSYAGCSFDATDTLLMKIEDGDPPDITSLLYSEVWGHLMDLTPYLSGYDLSNVDSAFFFKYRHNNTMPIMPLGIDIDLFFYNKDMFDSAGLTYPPHGFDSLYADGNPWDIGKLEEIAMKLTFDTKDSNAFSLDFDPSLIKQFGFHPWWINGISLTKMFGYPQIVSPDSVVSVPDYTRQGLKWYQDGIWGKRFIPNGQEHEDMDADPMGSGQVAMSYTYSSYSGNLEDVPFHWDIAASPSYNGKISIPWGLTSFGILNSCEHPQEAIEVIFAIANTVPFYGTTIPVFKNLREKVMDSLIIRFPEVDWKVLTDALNYIDTNTCDADGLLNNMAAWRLANDLRDYIQYEPDANIDGALDGYFIPLWEEIFSKPPVIPTNIEDVKPDRFSVQPGFLQAYPNPITESTIFSFSLQNPDYVKLSIYNLQGQEVETIINETYQSGEHQIMWEVTNLPEGIYFSKLQVGKSLDMIKLIISR